MPETAVNLPPAAALLSFDGFRLDEAEARLTFRGETVTIAPRPFALLCALARAPGMLVTKNALLDVVWGHRFVTDSAVKSAISDLRAALGDDPRQPRFVETVARRGYRFIAAAAAPCCGGLAGAEAGQGACTVAGCGPAHAAGQPCPHVLEALHDLCRRDPALGALLRAVAPDWLPRLTHAGGGAGRQLARRAA
jgi:hypothetical protein